MPSDLITSGSIPFKAEGRLLQELGLRLVASPEVALVELIKNAYDADSPDCCVSLIEGDEGTSLVVEDRGNGMTLRDFKEKWMQIATSSKAAAKHSIKYLRKMTGSKGIGRFAVRYLGDSLLLESVAYDNQHKTNTKLSATFDWQELDSQADIGAIRVPYRLTRLQEKVSTGTRLTIGALRVPPEFVNSRDLRAEVLRIVTPLSGLESGPITRQHGGGAQDPGFDLILPGEANGEDTRLADLVLKHYWARLTVSLQKKRLEFVVDFPHLKQPKTLTTKVDSAITNGFHCDIRFFPRRKGIFQAKEVNGREAWSWVRENSGVAVVDHGFRIRPFGFADDDWLRLDLDGAHNERNWRSPLAKEQFPIPEAMRGRPGDNPALNLPHNSQLVGAVFIECAQPSDKRNDDLIPAMDREGLLDTRGFKELQQYVRAGIEFLALCDKKELTRLAAREAKQAARRAREDIQEAIEEIEGSTQLSRSDKARVVRRYAELAEKVEEQEEYASAARRGLITMGLLGVVAGYMTHESAELLRQLEIANAELGKLCKKHPSLRPSRQELQERLEALRGYISYSELFIKSVGGGRVSAYRAAAQVNHVTKHFEKFAVDRSIRIANELPRSLPGPAVPIPAYSGLLLNLFTNALKAIVSVESSIDDPTIVFRGWNEPKHHFVEVLDNGIGIPPAMRKRIWDPLYTTTADSANPLGSGMGLGLSLVKQVTSEFGGKVSLVTPPPPSFSTCFRVVFPLA